MKINLVRQRGHVRTKGAPWPQQPDPFLRHHAVEAANPPTALTFKQIKQSYSFFVVKSEPIRSYAMYS
jgi:hypothetical protein